MARPHRFCVEARLEEGGAAIACHLADPGRLEGLLVPGAALRVLGPFGPPRKLAWSAALVEVGGVWVNLVTTVPNVLFEGLLRAGHLPGVAIPERIEAVEREVSIGGSRIDFRVHDDEGPCLVEVKSVTFEAGAGVGRFPDAPSARARRHVRELGERALRGERAAVVFITGRGDLSSVAPAEAVDPDFAEALREAAAAGVSLHGLRLTFDEVGAGDPAPIPVRTGEPP